jgi:uncharacterized protein YkwD
MKRVLAAIAVSALVLAGAAAGASPRLHGSARDAGQTRAAGPAAQRIQSVADLERKTVAAINDVRRQNGLAPVRLNRALSSAAREHSRAMAEHGFFAHDSLDGSAFWRRLELVYPPLPGRSWATGQNLVWASPDLSAKAALDLWMKSPPHRKNLLTPGWREVGLGGVHALAAPGVYEGLDVTILTANFGVR